MAVLSTAAWVAHDLGIATGVGGSLFGRVALHPSVRNISDREERGMVINDAWRTFSTIQLGALGLMAATWFTGRTMLSGREVDATSRGLVLAKDILVGTTLATGIGAAVVGRKLADQREGGAVPMTGAGEVSAEAPTKAKRLDRVVDVLGLVNILAGAGVIATTAILAMRAGQSTKWSAVSRFLR